MKKKATGQKKRSKKIVLGVTLSLVTMSVILSIMLGILLEPSVKIAGFESYNANNIVASYKTVRILDDNDVDVSGPLLGENKYYVSIEEVPKHTIDAFLSIEDKRFYSHKGIDYKRVASAFRRNTKAGSYKEGGSTITQQLAKNTHLSGEKTYKRKIQEARIARKIERKHSKSEILENYLNILYFGNNLYGIGSAARAMFDKDVSQLSIADSALLAAIINNPARYNPYRNYDNAIARRDLVLSQMYKQKKISLEDFEAAKASNIHVMPVILSKNHYYGSVLAEAAKILKCRESDLYLKNVTIATYLNIGLHDDIDTVLQKSNVDIETQNAHILVLCNYSGQVKAQTGFCDTRLSKLYRQPGSVIKPTMCYAPCIERRIIYPSTPILDEKANFGGYSPSNYKHSYDGWTSVENALSESSNVVAARLLEMCGVTYAKDFAKKSGYTFRREDNSLALALGAMHTGLTLQQIANSYQVFANNGKYIKSTYIKYILDADGDIIYKHKPQETHSMSDITAYFINDMLKTCAKTGTAKYLSTLGIENLAAKTGTVGTPQGNIDAYCVAYTPCHTVAVWIGAKDNKSPMTVTGGGLATVIAREVLHKMDLKNCAGFKKPSAIKSVDIDLNEYYNNHRLILADNSLALRYRKSAEFPKNNLPAKKIG